MSSSTSSRVFSSINWTMSSSIVNALASVIFGAILARLLIPADYGILAIANIIVAFAGYFVRMGIGPAIVQNENLSANDINFAVTFSLGLGFLAALLVALSSPLIASFFNKAEATPVIAAMSLSLWFTAFSSSISSLLQRDMKFKQISIINLGQNFFAGLSSIAMAYLGFGVWSLVWPLILSRFLGMLAILNMVRKMHPLKLRYSFTGHAHLLKFGSRYSVNSVLEYFGSNLDTISVGRLFSTAQVGLYNRAYLLAYLPTENLIASITSVMFPVFSRLQSEPKKFIETQQKLFLFVGLLSVSIALGMIPAARDIVLVLLGDKWLGAVPVLMVVLIAVPFDFMSVIIATTFDATGRLIEKTMIQIIAMLVLIVGIFLLYRFGLIGIAIALTLSHVIRFVIYIYQNQKIFSLSYIQLFRNLTMLTLVGLAIFSSSSMAAYFSKIWLLSPGLALFFEVITCLVIFILFLTANAPKLLGVKNLSQSLSVIQVFLITKKV